MVTACVPRLLPISYVRVEKPDAPRLGTLGACVRAQRADHSGATHLELLGHGPLRDALGVERPDLLVACEPARPPFLAGALIRRRAAERARIYGQQECRGRLACGQQSRQALMEPIEPPFERFPQVANSMPPIEDLVGLWCAKGGPTRIRCRAVTAHDADAWMRLEPRSKRIGRAVGPQVDRPMALQVSQQGAIGAPTTHGPIIDPQDGRRWHGRIRPLADEPQQGSGAGGHMQLGAQPRPGCAATREP